MNDNSSYVLGLIALIMVSVSCVFFVFYRAGGGRESRSKTVRYAGCLGKLLFAASVILLSVSVLNGFAKGEGRENYQDDIEGDKTAMVHTNPAGKWIRGDPVSPSACNALLEGPAVDNPDSIPGCPLACPAGSDGLCSATTGSSCGPYMCVPSSSVSFSPTQQIPPPDVTCKPQEKGCRTVTPPPQPKEWLRGHTVKPAACKYFKHAFGPFPPQTYVNGCPLLCTQNNESKGSCPPTIGSSCGPLGGFSYMCVPPSTQQAFTDED